MNKNFICATKECCTFEKYINAPYFRKVFEINEIKYTEISICGLGFYTLYINGNDVTKGPLAPYISNPDHLCYYDVYDITKYLTKGKNVIGIILGNGFYNPFGGFVWGYDKANWKNPPCVALEVLYDNEVLFEADESFKVSNSPIIFDDLRMGEYYDANQEIENWNLVDFDDSLWNNALISAIPRGKMKICNAENIFVSKRIKPINIFEQEDGFVYDFGENNAGVCTLKIKANKGQRIELWHGECIIDGKFNNYSTIFDRPETTYYKEYGQKDVYIAKGVGIEEYTPKFTYHGFRYVLVKGITKEQATKDLLTYNIMCSNLKMLGDFSCSDETLNTLFEMVKRSDLSNFYYFPTDCPHREKNGWTGDASSSAAHMMLLYDTEKSWKEWLYNIRLAQTEEGKIPGVVPTYDFGYGFGSGPAWDSVLFNLPYQLYKLRGNTDVIKENATAMVHYLDYILKQRNQDGTVSIGLGDWCPIGKTEAEYNVPVEFTDSVMVMDMARKASEMFASVGLYHQEKFANSIFEDFRNTIRNVLLDKETMIIKGNSQSGQAMGLYYGVFDEDEKQKAFDALLNIIRKNNNNFDSGFLGMHVLFHVLTEFGHSELAYNMITKKEYPSYRYLIEQGETTIVEMFMPGKSLWGSHNHHFFGDIARWFINVIAGLNIVDSNTVLIKPNFVGNINKASASYELPLGKVFVSWEKKNEKITINILKDKNIKYNVELPNDTSKENVTIIEN